MWDKLCTKLEGKIQLSTVEARNEVVFESLDGTFRKVGMLIVRGNDLDGYITESLLGKDFGRNFFVNDMEGGVKTLLLKTLSNLC